MKRLLHNLYNYLLALLMATCYIGTSCHAQDVITAADGASNTLPFNNFYPQLSGI